MLRNARRSALAAALSITLLGTTACSITDDAATAKRMNGNAFFFTVGTDGHVEGDPNRSHKLDFGQAYALIYIKVTAPKKYLGYFIGLAKITRVNDFEDGFALNGDKFKANKDNKIVSYRSTQTTIGTYSLLICPEGATKKEQCKDTGGRITIHGSSYKQKK